MQHPRQIRIATRSSPLALAQTRIVVEQLERAAKQLAYHFEIQVLPVVTTGDKLLDHPLSEVGGKGLFTKELETSLLESHADIAVHSLKDMPTLLPEGLMIGAVLEREDPRDALISSYADIAALPQGSVVGTSSLRRAALVTSIRPDISIIAFRGNVQTRLEKLKQGKAAATLLAMAGLKRLGLEATVTATALDPAHFTPAVGQGVIAIECRTDDAAIRELLSHIHHTPTHIAVESERALLAELDGSCRTPIGGYATVQGDRMHLHAFVATLDGSRHWRTERSGSQSDAARMGEDAGKELKKSAGSAVFS